MIKLLIVDDHALVRDGLKSMLSTNPDIEVIAEASNSEEAHIGLKESKPDVILMDIMLDDENGIEVAKEIKEVSPETKVLFLSMDVSEKFISEAVKTGAEGYLPKDIKKEILIEAINKVHNGGKYYSERVSEIILEKIYSDSQPNADSNKSKSLSKRETEVLKLIANGISNRDIAEKLFISVRTVDAHRNNILQKLKLKSTAELVKYAIREELISL